MLQIFLSNRVESLASSFKSRLYQGSSPFERRLVIVSSPFMQSWLSWQLVEDHTVGVAAGMEVCYWNVGLHRLLRLAGVQGTFLPSTYELSLAISGELRRWCQGEGCPDSAQHLVEGLREGNFRKRERNLCRLVEELCGLFQKYGTYGADLFDHWGKGWQQELWNRVVENPYRSLEMAELSAPTYPVKVHLFGIHSLPPLYFRFLERLGRLIPIQLYLLSPCQGFWSDSCSDKEILQMQKKGLSQEWLDYLLDRHPLLANMGRVGRQTARLIEEAEAIVEEHYELSDQVEGDVPPDIARFHKKALTLLEGLQADVVLQREDGLEKVDVNRDDNSLSLHIAANPMREVQVVCNQIRHCLERDPTLEPKDIVVMAPNIKGYVPFIQSVFESEEVGLDYQVYDLEAYDHSPLIQAFRALMVLKEGRWDREAVRQLLQHRPFTLRHKISVEQVRCLEEVMVKGDVLWGCDASHQEEIWSRESHVEQCKGHDRGTWEAAWERGLNAYALEGEIDGEALGKWMAILDHLRQGLKPFNEEVLRPISEWVGLIGAFVADFLTAVEEEDDVFQASFQELMQLGDRAVSWIELESYLKKIWERKGLVYRENHVQAIRFCSLLPMRAIPARVVVLMGMDERAFPKRKVKKTRDLMESVKKGDYQPSPTDLDRYLFLEAFLSARDYFLMTYSGKEEEEGGPSLVVRDLFWHLDQRFTIEGKTVSSQRVYEHPYDAHASELFSDPRSPYYSFSQREFALSQVKEEEEWEGFLASWFEGERGAGKVSLNETIDLSQLSLCTYSPLRLFYQEQLGMTFRKDEEWEWGEWFLSPLDLYLLKRDVTKKEKTLPYGIYGEIVERSLKEHTESLEGLEDVFSVSWSAGVDEPEKREEGWVLPPVECLMQSGEVITITGTIENVFSEGLLCEKAQSLRYYCALILLAVSKEQLSIPIQFVFIDTSERVLIDFKEPTESLRLIIELYQQCIKMPLYLSQKWISDWVEGDEIEMKSKILKSKDRLYDPYLLHGWDKKGMSSEYFDFWKNSLSNTFKGDFIEKVIQ